MKMAIKAMYVEHLCREKVLNAMRRPERMLKISGGRRT
jgi:hypothetical protein